jgi:hypothetical protein
MIEWDWFDDVAFPYVHHNLYGGALKISRA